MPRCTRVATAAIARPATGATLRPRSSPASPDDDATRGNGTKQPPGVKGADDGEPRRQRAGKASAGRRGQDLPDEEPQRCGIVFHEVRGCLRRRKGEVRVLQGDARGLGEGLATPDGAGRGREENNR